MSESLAWALVWILQVYAAIGLVFALLFAWFGVAKIDPAAQHGSWGFRLLIVPGAAALWPWLLLRWLRGAPPREERNAHRAEARR